MTQYTHPIRRVAEQPEKRRVPHGISDRIRLSVEHSGKAHDGCQVGVDRVVDPGIERIRPAAT